MTKKINKKNKQGMFYRSDSWPFFKKNIPVLFINMGFKPVDESKGKDYIYNEQQNWIKYCYHKPGSFWIVKTDDTESRKKYRKKRLAF